MSGHSKWSTIKRKKGAKDAARGKIFSRLVKEITVAVKTGGGDPDSNARLRTAIDAAKTENMPGQNIERAVKRGTGELPGLVYKEVTYEGFGPGGAAVLVQAVTDNRNRTVSEIRKIFEKNGGHLGDVNSVAWMFRQAGYFLVDAEGVDEDNLLSVALAAGAEDVTQQDSMYEVTSTPTDFIQVRDALKAGNIDPVTAEVAMLPNSLVTPKLKEAGRCLCLLEALEDHDAVQSVWANVDLDPNAAAQ